MNDLFKKIFAFRAGALSEPDGSPSASRVVMSRLSWAAAAVLIILACAAVKADAGKAAVILTALPAIIAALTAFVASPYGANRIGRWLDAKAANQKDEKDQPPAGNGAAQ
jgi:cell division protein FtsW (lipid II flippase)